MSRTEVRGGEGSIQAELDALGQLPYRIATVNEELISLAHRLNSVYGRVYSIALRQDQVMGALRPLFSAATSLSMACDRFDALKSKVWQAYWNYREADSCFFPCATSTATGFPVILVLMANSVLRKELPSEVFERYIGAVHMKRVAQLIGQLPAVLSTQTIQRLTEVANAGTASFFGQFWHKVGGTLNDYLHPKPLRVEAVERNVAPVTFHGRLEDIVKPGRILENHPSEIIITVCESPTGEKVYLVTLPGTQLEGKNNPNDLHGIVDSFINNSEVLRKAIAQAMDSLDPPPGEQAKVIINGFSQGGISAKNLVGSAELQKYDIQLVLTEGAPDSAGVIRDPNVTYIDIADESDYTPSFDGKVPRANARNIEIITDVLPIHEQLEFTPLGVTHNLEMYENSLRTLDRDKFPQIKYEDERISELIRPGSTGELHFFKLTQPRWDSAQRQGRQWAGKPPLPGASNFRRLQSQVRDVGNMGNLGDDSKSRVQKGKSRPVPASWPYRSAEGRSNISPERRPYVSRAAKSGLDQISSAGPAASQTVQRRTEVRRYSANRAPVPELGTLRALQYVVMRRFAAARQTQNVGAPTPAALRFVSSQEVTATFASNSKRHIEQAKDQSSILREVEKKTGVNRSAQRKLREKQQPNFVAASRITSSKTARLSK